jgi:hypothetical protein
MKPTTYDSVHELLSVALGEAVAELFASLGHEITAAGPEAPLLSQGPSVASSIGYSHQSVSGTLTVIGSLSLLRALLAELRVEPSVLEDAHDIGGEVNNMLLGRVKNKCGRFGLSLKLGTPTTVRGVDLQMAQAPAPSLTSTWSAFSAAGERFYVRLDTLIASGFTRQVMCFKEDLSAPGIAEGEGLFFDE